MRKIAKEDSPAWIFVPGHRALFGADPDVSALPQVFADESDNKLLWSTLGAATSAGIISALITRLSNRRARRQLEKKRKEVHQTKVDSLYPSAEADELRVAKTASAGVLDTVLPITAAIATGYGVHQLTSDNEEKDYAQELDERIAQQRAKLQKLYDRLEQIYSTGDTHTITKQASAPNISGRALALAALGLLAMHGVGLAGGYYYTKKHSDEDAAKKVLEEGLLADNLTNIPDTVAMQLDPRGK